MRIFEGVANKTNSKRVPCNITISENCGCESRKNFHSMRTRKNKNSLQLTAKQTILNIQAKQNSSKNREQRRTKQKDGETPLECAHILARALRRLFVILSFRTIAPFSVDCPFGSGPNFGLIVRARLPPSLRPDPRWPAVSQPSVAKHIFFE